MPNRLITYDQLKDAIGKENATAGALRDAQDWGEKKWPDGLPADHALILALKTRFGSDIKHESTLKLTSKLLKKMIKEELEKIATQEE